MSTSEEQTLGIIITIKNIKLPQNIQEKMHVDSQKQDLTAINCNENVNAVQTAHQKAVTWLEPAIYRAH